MANILKLQNAGDVATLDITGCEVVEGQYGEQVQFDAGEDRLYLPKTSADRQLERLYPNWDFEYGQVIGERLAFSRSASTKPGAKPFWNIDRAKKANGKPPVSSATTEEKPRLDRLYLRATRLVLDEVVPLYVKAGIGCSDTAVAAMTAALFIAASKEG